MRIVCLSDTHDSFREFSVPDGDLLLHGGDLSRRGTLQEVTASANWLRSLPHPHKVVIGGNHDFCLERGDPREILHGLSYLQDEWVVINGIKIFGSPWSPTHGNWAFQADRGEPLRECWQRIPGDTQILITHGPPHGILDRHVSGTHLGCHDLAQRVEQVKPTVHLFGHVHESYGCLVQHGTLFINASNCSFGYKKMQPAVVLDWQDGQVQLQPPPAEKGKPVETIEAWEILIRQYGAPREVRYLPAASQQQELSQGHVFWLEINSDGFGSGDVLFRPARPNDDVTDRGSDHLHRRWAFTLGVPVHADWLQPLNCNPWERYGEVPHLPL